MTPSWGDSGFKLEPRSREERKPTWPRVLGLIGLVVLAFIVAKGCQDREIEVTQEEAVASAREAVDFEPRYTQVRLLRQGLNRKAYWFVSLSIPIGFSGDRPDLFSELSVVKIDAKSGDIISVSSQEAKETKEMEREAAQRDQDAAVEKRLDELEGSQ